MPTKKKPLKLYTQNAKTWSDFKNAALFVSLIINLAFLVLFIAARLSDGYDVQIVKLIFG